MKQLLRKSIDDGLARLRADGTIPGDATADYQIEIPRHDTHGDYSTNVAMLLAGACRRPPRAVAEALSAVLADDPLLERIDVAGPGFINFTVADAALYAVVGEIIDAGSAWGRNDSGAGRKIQVEYVSANPTGPLHIGHGRGAAIGSVIAALLDASGFAVVREYYVNDAGRQMDILALSVYLRFLEAHGAAIEFPPQAYQGAYIRTIAARFAANHDDSWRVAAPGFDSAAEDAERALDAAISELRSALGEQRYLAMRRFAMDDILAGIREDLGAFGVEFERWYSEASLEEAGLIERAVTVLEQAGHIYSKDGARWFRSSALGDEKDRVVVRENGLKTYFASDIAYHMDKFERGFDAVIDVWGADHHGYVARVKAAIKALGADPGRLDIVLVQFASLLRGGEKVAMSTRSGEFVTLRELVDEVGVDAARFFYVMRRADQHLEFDLDLATAQSSDNPVYYVQYAHARICSVFRQLELSEFAPAAATPQLAGQLTEAAERRLTMLLARFPETIAQAAAAREPHGLTQYLRDLAHEFHGYYNSHKILLDDAALRDARLHLITAVRQVLGNGLDILGISAPQEM